MAKLVEICRGETQCEVCGKVSAFWISLSEREAASAKRRSIRLGYSDEYAEFPDDLYFLCAHCTDAIAGVPEGIGASVIQEIYDDEREAAMLYLDKFHGYVNEIPA